MMKKRRIRGGNADEQLNILDTEMIMTTNLFDQIDSLLNKDGKIQNNMRKFLDDIKKLCNKASKNDISTILNTVDKNSVEEINSTTINDLKVTEYNSEKTKDNFNKKFTFFECVTYLVNKYGPTNSEKLFINKYNEFSFTDIFAFYELWNVETAHRFITIDPTIIQIMLIDSDTTKSDEDKIYSFKLIYKNNKLIFRYTTDLFPNEAKIKDFSNLKQFNKYNTDLNCDYITKNFNKEFEEFLVKYLNLYEFYKKCYVIGEPTKPTEKTESFFDYQMKYISILGKARFFDKNLQVRCKLITDYIMTNLVFVSPAYAFISGGYKGFSQSAYGITRSGYEISKKYNRPIFTIMCNEGRADYNEYSDSTLIYGEHWGEDSVALSQFTDGAIIVAPFGGWTYIECLTLLANEKIIGIYNDCFNILNYDTNKNNKYFFAFNKTEQASILMYYINYYIIMHEIIQKAKKITNAEETLLCLNEITQIIKFIFILKEVIFYYESSFKYDYNKIDNLSLLINTINALKTSINIYIESNYINLYNSYKNIIYKDSLCVANKYQDILPVKFDGIWLKPKYNFDNVINNNKIFYIYNDDDDKRKIGINYINSDISNINKSDVLEKLYNLLIFNYIYIEKNSIMNNLNNNIIFVFSNILYLNIYLNKNLQNIRYQTILKDKIDKLKDYLSIHSNKTINSLIKEQNSVTLARNLDGYLDMNGEIKKDTILNDDYHFILDRECYNYTSLISTNASISRNCQNQHILESPEVIKKGGKKSKSSSLRKSAKF